MTGRILSIPFVVVFLLSLLVVPPAFAGPSILAGPPAEEPPQPGRIAANPSEAHEAAASGSVEPAEAVAVSFAEAVAAAAAEPVPEGVRFHVQGDLGDPQSGPGVGPVGPQEPVPADVPPPKNAPGEAGPRPRAPGDFVRSFDGIDFTGWIPPDTVAAVGPTHVVEAVNSGFAVYSKVGGTLQGYTTFASFMAPALPVGWQGYLFDPRVLYSPEYSKFVMLALGIDSVNQDSFFFIAVSQTSDPTGSWWLYRFASDVPNTADSDSWADYCGLGGDTWGVYVSCNMFRWIGGFKYAKLWSLGPAIFSGGTVGGWSFWDLRWNNNNFAGSLQPVQAYSVTGDQASFFVNTYSSSGSSVLLWKLTGDRTNSPVLTRATIATQTYNAINENVDQPGSSADIDGGDARVMNAAYKGRKVYAVLTTDVLNDGRQSGWLLFKLDVDTNSRDWQYLLWTSTTATTGGFYYFYPAITLDGAGGSTPNLAVFGNWTDSETVVTPETYYASGLYKVFVDQPTSGAGPFFSFDLGLAPYLRRDSNGRNRWGDYSGAAFDWSTGLAWGAVEVAGLSNRWYTVLSGVEVGSASGGCSADGFEPDGSGATAKGIVSGLTQVHSICPSSDVDWVTFDLPAESAVRIETGGAAGDTRLWLFDDALAFVDFNDDGGTGLFSLIERTCASNPLPAGTYYAKVDEFGNDDEIDSYDLTYSLTQGCSGVCPSSLILSNQVIGGTQTFRAGTTITLGPDLVVNGTAVRMVAGQKIVLGPGTEIHGGFSAGVHVNPCTAVPGAP